MAQTALALTLGRLEGQTVKAFYRLENGRVILFLRIYRSYSKRYWNDVRQGFAFR